MNRHSWALRRYLWEARRWLPCSGKAKREILGQIEVTISEYLQENPDASYALLTEKFGPPTHIAASCVEVMEPEEAVHGLRIDGKVLAILGAVIVLMAIMRVGFIAAARNCYERDENGYAVMETITREEYDRIMAERKTK